MSETETATPPASPDLGSLSSSDLQTWRQTGDVPAPKTSDTSDVAESSPAEPDVQAAEIAALPPAASEPAPSKKANAETRKAELNAEIQALLKQRDEIKASLSSTPSPTARDVNRVEPSPTPQPRSLETVIQSPDVNAPILTEEQFYTEFPDASVGAYVRYAARYEAKAIERESLQTQTRRQRETTFAERAATIPADVLPKIPPQIFHAKPRELMGPDESPTVWNDVVTEALNSAQTGPIFAYLTDHPEAVTQLASCQNQAETIRVMAQIEARLGPSVQPKPVVKTTTSAPPPPLTLGSKPSIPADDVDEALATGDVGKYIRVMNAREMAQRR